jgi:hypothetical protein
MNNLVRYLVSWLVSTLIIYFILRIYLISETLNELATIEFVAFDVLLTILIKILYDVMDYLNRI